MKTSRKISIIYLLFLFGSFNLFAQDDYAKWLEKQKESYQQYLAKEDSEFLNFLEAEWKAFQIETGKPFDAVPKPKVFPEYKPKTDEIIETKIIEFDGPVEKPDEIIEKKEENFEPESLLEETPEKDFPDLEENSSSNFKDNTETMGISEPTSNEDQFTKIEVDFFGNLRVFSIPEEFNFKLENKPDNKAISSFWLQLAKSNYEALLKEILSAGKIMNLNDWGYLVLLYNTAKKIYPDSPDTRHLFVWFMLNKSSYKAKIGSIDDKLFLFMPIKNKLFGVPFITLESSGSRLYVLDMDNLLSPIEGSIYTYDQDYGPADKILDMSMNVLPEIGKRGGKRNISFSYEGADHKIKVVYNQNRINFLRDYPYSDLKIYFNSAVNPALNSALLDSFKGILEGKNELEKTNIILRFVQTATGYKTDPENFGSEKPLFVEESLYYPFSDCEDRSILFAYLIKILVGLDVIGLDYPGHIATAVKLGNQTPGYTISYKGDKYIICDPTYIGARVGVCMPDYLDVAPDAVIEILN